MFTLVSLFIPFTAALFIPWVKSTGCIAAMILGLLAWVVCLTLNQEVLGTFIGIFASVIGLIAGTILEPKLKKTI